MCWPGAFPCRWTFRAPTKHSCTSLLLLGTQTLDASQKTNPQKTLPEILWWCITSVMWSLVTSLGPQALPLLLPSLDNTTPAVSHTLAPSLGCFRSVCFFLFRKRLIYYRFNFFNGILLYILNHLWKFNPPCPLHFLGNCLAQLVSRLSKALASLSWDTI